MGKIRIIREKCILRVGNIFVVFSEGSGVCIRLEV